MSSLDIDANRSYRTPRLNSTANFKSIDHPLRSAVHQLQLRSVISRRAQADASRRRLSLPPVSAPMVLQGQLIPATKHQAPVSSCARKICRAVYRFAVSCTVLRICIQYN